MSYLKHGFAACALASVAACGESDYSQHNIKVVPTDVAYCLVDPQADRVEIIATQTDTTMYKASRNNDRGYGNALMAIDGTPEKRVLFLTSESCVVAGLGHAVEYTAISSRLRTPQSNAGAEKPSAPTL
jgi:hypothetical protein